MENKNTISDELMDISPVIAGIGNQNPYAVPPSYFDGLAVQIMLRIALEEKAGTDPVLNINKDNIYQAPAHYFDTLAGDIMNRIKAEETGSAKEELELFSPLLGQIRKKNPFTSPEGYFTDFPDNIMAGVKAIEFVNEELENLSPLMLELRHKQIYETPEGYFETIAATILDKAKQQQQPAKVINIGFGRKMMRYAAAAVVVGILGSSVYFISNKSGKPDNVIASTKTGLDSIGIAKISDPEIENFLDNNTNTLADLGNDTTNTILPGDANIDDSKDLLADVSDEELQKYVEQQSETPITN